MLSRLKSRTENSVLNIITGIGVSKIENRKSTGKYVKIFNMSK